MIRFTNASKRYPGGHDALLNVNFHLEPGEMAFLTGHSGAGKSTFLKLIALIERTTRGQVLVNNQNLSKLKKRNIPYFRRNIGIIFQDHQLLFDRTVFDNVALPLIISRALSAHAGMQAPQPLHLSSSILTIFLTICVVITYLLKGFIQIETGYFFPFNHFHFSSPKH